MGHIIKAADAPRGFNFNDLKSWVARAETIVAAVPETPKVAFKTIGGRYAEDTPVETTMIIDVEYSVGLNKLTFILGD